MNEEDDDLSEKYPDPSWGNYELFKIYEDIKRDEMKRQVIRNPRKKITADQRLQYKREREALVGKLITQKGPLCGGLVKEHVRGSQYVVCLADGTEAYASHKKAHRGHSKPPTSHSNVSTDGWRLWEDRV